MDRIDRELLRLLAIDGRRSYTDLGDAVHLSANAVAERVRRLVKAGVIRHIRASIDPTALGRGLEAQVDVKLLPGTPAAAFEAALRELPQVLSATLMTGSFDYALRVACVDRDELIQVAEALRDKAGAGETYSRIILREVALGG